MDIRHLSSRAYLAFLVLVLAFFAGCHDSGAIRGNGPGSGLMFLQKVDKKNLPPLSEQEKQDLAFMRQEEKLARDVYMELSKKWTLPRLNNIVDSEQRHMDALKRLLELYDLPDPITKDTPGVFPSDHFSTLYKKLTSQGSRSIVDALKVGATIEDLDIKDLEECIKRTRNTLLIRVYENLMRGSRNHLRYFISELKARNATYEPQYISKQEFEEIISTPFERGKGGNCPGGGMGKGPGKGRRTPFL